MEGSGIQFMARVVTLVGIVVAGHALLPADSPRAPRATSPHPAPSGLVPFGPPNPDDYEIAVGNGSGVTGGTAAVPVLLNFANGMGVTGFSFGVCSDPDLVDIECVGGFPNDDCIQKGIIVQGADLAATNQGQGAEFFNPAVQSTPSPGWTVGVLINLQGGVTLPPEDGAEVVICTYRLLGPDGTVVPLTPCETGDPAVLFSVTTAAGNVVPRTTEGQITIGDAGSQSFLRADADGNGTFNGLNDALFILQFQFQSGLRPPCMEAADADGNGVFNGLNDALYTLGHQFQSGPPPPAPYPECGLDPDPPGLGCNQGCP